MRDRVQRIPEENQYINFAFRNLRADLLVATQGAAQHRIHFQPCFTMNQIASGACRRQVVFFQQSLVALNPVKEHLLAMIVCYQRNMFTFWQGTCRQFHNLFPSG
ncbi:hypothetical protein D3C87_1905850 [compost metagenome]